MSFCSRFVFFPSYLLLIITYFFLHSVVNKVQTNLLSKCIFLSVFLSSFRGNVDKLGTCGLMGKEGIKGERTGHWPVLRPSSRQLVCKVSNRYLQGSALGRKCLGASPLQLKKSPRWMCNLVGSTQQILGSRSSNARQQSWVITKKNLPKGICRNTTPGEHQILSTAGQASLSWAEITLIWWEFLQLR